MKKYLSIILMVICLLVFNVLCSRTLDQRLINQRSSIAKEAVNNYSLIMIEDSYKNIEKDVTETKVIMYVCDLLGILIIGFTIKGFFIGDTDRKVKKNNTTFGDDVEDDKDKLRDPRD